VFLFCVAFALTFVMLLGCSDIVSISAHDSPNFGLLNDAFSIYNFMESSDKFMMTDELGSCGRRRAGSV